MGWKCRVVVLWRQGGSEEVHDPEFPQQDRERQNRFLTADPACEVNMQGAHGLKCLSEDSAMVTQLFLKIASQDHST